MYEIIFLSLLALIWICFAVIEDLKSREIANWLNFSLIIFALGFRFFYSLFFKGDFSFFYQGLIGLVVFFVLGNIFYYGKLFAGGDAKLMIALGPILPLYNSFNLNVEVFIYFLLIFLFSGGIYTLAMSFYLSAKNFGKFKKEFRKQLRDRKSKLLLSLTGIFVALTAVFGFIYGLVLMYSGILVFVLSLIYIYSKAVDESCMVQRVSANLLTEGDWLYEDIIIGKKTIKAKWDGLSKSEIEALRQKGKKVLIRKGVPFSPVFLISFIILLYFFKVL